MSAPQFTPGPWHHRLYASPYRDELCGESDNFHLLRGREGDSGGTILEGSLVLADDAENTANACLIAAAPELYEALETLLASVYANIPKEDQGISVSWAQTALAKARGGQ